MSGRGEQRHSCAMPAGAVGPGATPFPYMIFWYKNGRGEGPTRPPHGLECLAGALAQGQSNKIKTRLAAQVAHRMEDGAWMRVRRNDERSRQKSARSAGPNPEQNHDSFFYFRSGLFSIERIKTGVVFQATDEATAHLIS